MAVAAALAPARRHIASPTVALLLVLVVVTVAAVTGRRVVALVAALGAAAGFDYFHTLPYGSLSIRRSEDVQVAVLLVVVAGLGGELGLWGRRHRDAAVDAQSALALVAAFSARAGGDVETEPLVLQLAAAIGDLLEAVDCHFDRGAPRPAAAVMQPDGTVAYANLAWDPHREDLPGREIVVAATWRGQRRGQFAAVPAPGQPVPVARRHAAAVLATFAGARLQQASP